MQYNVGSVRKHARRRPKRKLGCAPGPKPGSATPGSLERELRSEHDTPRQNEDIGDAVASGKPGRVCSNRAPQRVIWWAPSPRSRKLRPGSRRFRAPSARESEPGEVGKTGRRAEGLRSGGGPRPEGRSPASALRRASPRPGTGRGVHPAPEGSDRDRSLRRGLLELSRDDSRWKRLLPGSGDRLPQGRQARKREPRYAFNLRLILMRQSRPAARPFFEKAIEIEPRFEGARRHLDEIGRR